MSGISKIAREGIMIIFFVIVLVISGSVWIFMRGPAFGRLPAGERLERIRHSPHYRNNQFRNIHDTPNLVEGASMFTIMKKFFFEKNPGRKPKSRLPSTKTDLINMDRSRDLLVWFGHSSYYIQVDGKRFLVDPVFSGAASPIPATTRSFAGTDVCQVGDLPEIDYLIITHDHWDHLDYRTVLKLRPKAGRVITSLGTAAHLEYWGYRKDQIIEEDWGREIVLEDGFVIQVLPARHFAGRTFRRNRSFWMSLALRTPTMNFYLGGDSGFDTHFAEIGARFGPFDLAILECGQYNHFWKYIHMMPEEMVQAGFDLKARRVLPVHWGKFSLSIHDWDEPIRRAVNEAERRALPLLYPRIGESVNLHQPGDLVKWWESGV
jgi:L-ascorbate metabolism protein UlaG (beta-lactamase superfamily)